MIGEEKVIHNDSSDSDYDSQETDKSQPNSNDTKTSVCGTEKNGSVAECYGTNFT